MIQGRRLEDIHPIREELVRPAGGGNETLWLAVAAVVVVVACALGMGLRDRGARTAELLPWQMNAFTALNPEELGTFNALYTAAVEIDAVHEDGDGGWMDISEMEDLFMPPFARDAAWRRQGRMVWTRRVPESPDLDLALYLGVPQQRERSGSFLLVMRHDHSAGRGHGAAEPGHGRFEVWYQASHRGGFPAVIKDQALIAAGWKEVVAFKGGDEIERVKGEVVS
ncbi:DUF6162 family protein [Salidesulfovibrio onnuriiensis]|uniref:DUF6162 family protein n=1 Tax=Salidesulfovibrio onnuriiensis TaxID=2583823 RepID=UPI0011CC12E1|nr:DUF6162 family protein [Salidesulfovibrio onnuriiensis]